MNKTLDIIESVSITIEDETIKLYPRDREEDETIKLYYPRDREDKFWKEFKIDPKKKVGWDRIMNQSLE